jgi:hypothetical protein
MDRKIKRKWVKALRSGRYQQAQSELKTENNTYCCLGVLCNVVGARWANSDEGWLIAKLKGAVINVPNGEILTPKFLKQIGLTKYRQDILTRMNDGEGFTRGSSFTEIAAYIDKNL